MKKPAALLGIMGVIFMLLSTSGCQDSNPLDAKDPVTLTMWHNFGGDMQTTMDLLLDEFNSTIGKEEGIIINVTAISSSKELQENLDMIVNGDPGAPEIPDLFTAYPKTAFHFQEKDMLVNFDDYFTEEELSKYVLSFIQEGRFGDNGLYVFPFAKSTEILFLNKTLFDRFAAENDVTTGDLATIEGILQTSVKYYEWTDAKTPDIEQDGKMFFAADSWLNFTQSVFAQQGAQLFQDDKINLNQDTYTRLWNLLYPAVAKGGIAIYDGYSSDLSKTGDLVCSVGSTAGIIFYGDTITYSDNTVEEVAYDILPYPIMNGANKIAIQR
ncbi:MAG: extracellular solute-binding protein, partial [Mobilitalea sp.]